MSITYRKILLFSIMLALLITVGFVQSWNVALLILNMCTISAIMALGVNLQWGYAGLFNAGIILDTSPAPATRINSQLHLIKY